MVNIQEQKASSAQEVERKLRPQAEEKGYRIAGDSLPRDIYPEHITTEVTRVDQVAEDYTKETQEAEKLRLEIKEKNDVLGMRKEWSTIFKGIVKAILLFEITLTIFVGLGIFKFSDEWFLRIIISGGFAQILLLPFTLTKFLFNTDSKLSKN